MKIKFNSVETEVPENTTVSALRKMKDIPVSGVAVAVNGKIVRASGQESYILGDGDDVIVIGAAYGG